MIEVLEKSWNFQSSIGNTVRDYFKDTVTPHFFNVAISCIVLTITIYMKKLLDSDWLRAVQFKCNTSAKSVTQITHGNSGL